MGTRLQLGFGVYVVLCVAIAALLLTGCPPSLPPDDTPPIAAFSATPTGGAPGLRVQFTDASDAGSSAITVWLWRFGDSETSSVQHPVHIYQAAGTFTVELTVSSAAGSDTLVKNDFIVVAEAPDTTAPVISLRGSAEVVLECGVEAWDDPGATAVDERDGVVEVVAGGDAVLSTVGVYTIRYDAVDAAGNTAAPVTRVVRVVDSAGPVIHLSGGDLRLSCAEAFADPGATAMDACSGAVAVAVEGTVDTGTPGSYTLHYSAVDSAGNQSSLTRRALVVDEVAPVIALNGGEQILECGAAYQELGAMALDGCDGAVEVQISGNVATDGIGAYRVTYTAVDGAGNRAEAQRLVTVADTAPPVIELVDGDVTLGCGERFSDPGYAAHDGCGGAVQVVVEGAPSGGVSADFVVKYIATDSAGNRAEAQRLVSVVDDEAPAIVLTEGNILLDCGDAYVEPGYSAYDSCDGRVGVSVEGAPSVTTVGNYTIHYSATDGAGNRTEVERIVHVIDRKPPVMTLEGGDIDLTCGAEFVEPGYSAVDACDGELSVEVTGLPAPPEGDFVVAYQATDGAGNIGHTTRMVRRIANQAPVITLLGGTVTTECGTEYVEPGYTVTDDCDEQVAVTVSRFQNMRSLLLYEAIDSDGAMGSAMRGVNVVDTIPPVLSLIGGDMEIGCGDVWVEPGYEVIELCTPASVEVELDTVQADEPGVQVLSYRARDTSYNWSETLYRTVTVLDDEPPTIALTGDEEVTLSLGQPFERPDATAVDGCGFEIPVVFGGDTLDVYTPGVYLLTYEAIDSQGRKAQRTRTVTVEDLLPSAAPTSFLIEGNPGTALMTTTRDGGFVFNGLFSESEYYIQKTDAYGAVEWIRPHAPGEAFQWTWGASTELKDGNLLFSGSGAVSRYSVENDQFQGHTFYRDYAFDTFGLLTNYLGDSYHLANPSTAVYKAQMRLAKLGQDDELIWDKTITTTRGYVYGAGFGMTPDGTIIVFGDIQDNTATGDVYLGAYSPAGDKLWEKILATGSRFQAKSICTTRDGGYAILVNNPSSSLADRKQRVIRFDRNRQQLWEYSFTGDASFEKLVSTPDNAFVVAGTIAQEALVSGIKMRDLLIHKIDDSGQLVWARTWGDVFFEAVRQLLVTRRGDLVIRASSNSFQQLNLPHSPSSTPNVPVILTFDLDGNMPGLPELPEEPGWIKDYEIDALTTAVAIVPSGDTEYLVAVNCKAGTTETVALLTIDEAGTPLSLQRPRFSVNNEMLSSMTPTSDGGVVGVGQSGTGLLAFKRDSAGSIAWQVTDTTSPPGTNVIELSNGDHLVTGYFYLDRMYRPQLTRLDAEGQLIATYTWPVTRTTKPIQVLETVMGGFAVLSEAEGSYRSDVLTLLNGEGVPQMEMLFNHSSNNTVSSMVHAANGDLLLAGSKMNYPVTGSESWGWMLRLSAAGEAVSEHYMGQRRSIRSIFESHDGTYVLQGYPYLNLAGIDEAGGQLWEAKGTWLDVPSESNPAMVTVPDGFLVVGQSDWLETGTLRLTVVKTDRTGQTNLFRESYVVE